MIAALAPLAARTKLIAVLFADRAPDLALLPVLARAGFAGAMLDTADKDGSRLLDHMDLPHLRGFVAACRAEGMLAGLAGALEAPDVPRLLVLAPDVLGFRGALTGSAGRAAPIAREAVQAIRALIPPEDAPADGGGVDYRLLAARGYAPDPNGDPAFTDRVFVRDLVLPVRIGAYARERAAPQRVRFAVEVLVTRAARASADMRDVFSYDVITDGIRLLIDAGHVPLVETLAERIAEMLLAHPRVVTRNGRGGKARDRQRHRRRGDRAHARQRGRGRGHDGGAVVTRHRRAAPLVVKLGGSHAGSALLRPWLRAIEAAAGRVVLVPGGGPFADAVRDAQATMAIRRRGRRRDGAAGDGAVRPCPGGTRHALRDGRDARRDRAGAASGARAGVVAARAAARRRRACRETGT